MLAKKHLLGGSLLTAALFSFMLLVAPKFELPSQIYVKESNFKEQHSVLMDPPRDWGKVNVSAMTIKDVIDYFLWTNSTSCGLVHDFGGFMMQHPSGFDGQKAICLDPGVAPVPGRCLVYSFGINNEWSFDDTMEKYGCEVFSFDPSMWDGDHNRTDHIHFYNIGIDGSEGITLEGWEFRTLSSLYDDLKTYHGEVVIDYLKMDVEGAEWKAIPQIIESGMINKVRQIGVEFHLSTRFGIGLQQMASIVKSIEDAGFIRFDSKYNPWWTGRLSPQDEKDVSLGYEIAWYRILP